MHSSSPPQKNPEKDTSIAMIGRLHTQAILYTSAMRLRSQRTEAILNVQGEAGHPG
jgi:hypothetical protein